MQGKMNAHPLHISIIIAGSIFAAPVAFGASPSVAIFPDAIRQGDPVLVQIADGGMPRAASFDGAPLAFFRYDGKPSALIGIDLKKPPGDYRLRVEFENGDALDRTISVTEREKREAPLGIPEKLGGNTPESEQKLLSTLALENAVLAELWTQPKALWTKPFRAPLNTEIVVTDPYGYSRKTVGSLVAHKGTDFRAEEYTRVRAMNRGVVRLARTFRNYGKTIVVDHGLGLQTLYMHLSAIRVNPGELVLPGRILGLSGQTGYAESPHLHVSVKMGGVSIDPVAFLSLFAAPGAPNL
jgi:murein DD-endopeptidase MepM/ murein hydrolase activator NlpD